MNFPYAGPSLRPTAAAVRAAFATLASMMVVVGFTALPLDALAQATDRPANPAAPVDPASTTAPADLPPAAPVDSDSVTSSDLLNAPPETLSPAAEQRLPHVELSSQIMFQVLAAEIALQRGEVGPAYQTYLALAQDTHDPRTAQRATEIALAAQSPNDALTAARLWHQDAPASSRAAQVDASLLVLTGHLTEAEPLLAEELAKVQPAERPDAILALQLLVSRSQDRVGGVATLTRLLKNDMQRPEALYAIGRQHLLADDPPAAKASLEAALKIQPDFEPAALTLAQMGDAERQEVIASLTAFVQKNPSSRSARLTLAQLYLGEGKLDDAQAQFEAMRKLDPKDAPPLLALALIQLQRKHNDAAQTLLQQYAQLTQAQGAGDPGQAYVYLSQIALDKKDEATALDWLSKVTPQSNQYFAAQITRAQILAQQKQYDQAHAVLAQTQPASVQEKVLLVRADAGVSMQAGQSPQAEKELAELSRAVPSDPDVLYDYAMAAERNGHYDLMETQLRKLMVLDPTNAQAYNALGYSLADRNVKLDEAGQLVAKAVALAPGDPFILDSQGWVKYRQGDLNDAATLLQKAYSIRPNAEIGAHLGEVLWVQGRRDDARASWRNAQKLEPDNDTLVKTLKRLNAGSL
ncbi:MAG: tetratricopeptide repeat protein [Janthinobacterium lividum]